MAKGEKPQWRLAALDKETGHTGNVGVAWDHESGGRISIKLNAFVKLEASEELVLTLFREDWKKKASSTDAPVDDKDIPF